MATRDGGPLRPRPGDLRLAVEDGPDRNVSLIRLSGALEIDAVGEFERALERLLSRPGRPVVLDLTELTFIDSTGLRSLLRVAEHGHAAGDRLRVIPPQGEVDRMLRLTGIRASLPLYE